MNRAFLLGDALFETLRLWSGRPLRWPLHRERLWQGAQTLGFQTDDLPGWEAWPEIFQQEWEKQGRPEHARLRLTLYRAGPGPDRPETDHTLFHLLLSPLNYSLLEGLPPARLVTYADFRLRPTLLSGLKTTNRLPYVLAARHARQAGADDALLLDEAGNLAEATASNLFWLRHDTLFTPSLETGCLPGTLRRALLEQAPKLGLAVAETFAAPDVLREAEAVILSNAIAGIREVGMWMDFPLKTTPLGERLVCNLRTILQETGLRSFSV